MNMKASIKRFVARYLAAIASRLTDGQQPQARPPFPGEPADLNIGPEQLNYPPFDGNPEVAHSLWEEPPIAMAKEKRMTTVLPNGSLPDSIELMKLTAAGKVLARTDFVLYDDFGLQGEPGQSPSPCQFCSRMAFKANPCAGCGRMACPLCGRPVEINKQVVILCEACGRQAVLQRDNWQQIEP
jgi:hypothetical protein